MGLAKISTCRKHRRHRTFDGRSAGAAPFNIRVASSGERTLGRRLLAFAGEIQSPCPDLYREISEYLRESARRDGLACVCDQSDAKTLCLGDKVIFCGRPNADSPLSLIVVRKMNPALFSRTCDLDWITVGGSAGGDTLRRHFDYFGSSNYLAETLDAC